MCIYKCMLNMYKNQQNRQTGSRNLMGPKTLPTIWRTYMYCRKRFLTRQIPTFCLPTLLIFLHIEHICSFFVAFFSATIDGRILIFGHKLHIGTPYRGKRFWTHQILNKMNCELMLTYDIPALRQTESRNLMGPKTLPTIK
jgi:hypothetical protein